ncbi:MAG: hypothetical protein ACTHN5_17470 [Phycisphaerae bacterium]
MTLLDEPSPPPAARDVPAPPPIPRRLEEPLQMVAGRARLLAILLALFKLMALVLAAWLLVTLLLGGIREPALPLAFALAAAAWATLFIGAVLLFRPAFRRTDLSAAARMVDIAIPDTDERISSALELSQEEDPRFRGSPELIAALVRQAEHHAEAVDPNAVVSGSRVFRWFLAAIPLLLIWFILLVVMMPTLTLGLERLFQPWRAAAPLVTATLDVDPRNVSVAQGDSVTITVTVTPTDSGLSTTKEVKSASITQRFAAGNTNEDVTTDMERTDLHTFRKIFDNVQQGFSYRIESMGAKSPTYTVSVDPRPAVGNIQVDYAYPKYTGREAHTETSRDGAVDALVGTQVKLTIDTTQPVKIARMVITDNAPDPGAFILQPLDKTNTKFTTSFTVRKTTDYKIQLVNEHELENKDTRAHPITARLDAPPTITITAPEGNLRIRPDDRVQVRFAAADDFQLTKIEAVAQADEEAPVSFLLPALPPKSTSFNGQWAISLHDLVSAGPAADKIKRITYFLRATDNRDPAPQTGISAKQVLEIDQKVAPLADRQDAQAARTLGEAVKQAGSQLDDAKQKLDTLRKTAGGRPLTEPEKQQAGDARNEISRAAQALQNAAGKTNDSSMADAARRAKEIADEPMKQADENTAAGQLASDQPDLRDKKFDAARQNIDDARSRLDQLAREIDNKAKDQPLARELHRIAAEQKKLAEQLAQHPNDPALLAKQKQLQKDLENVIKQHPELEKPAAEAAKSDTQDVQKKLDDLANAQNKFNEQAKAQQDATVAQDKLNDLAKKQEALNQQIKDFTGRRSDALRQAEAAHTPSAAQLDSIPRDLKNRNLTGATQGQSATANQLDQAAQQLENSQRREDSGEGITNAGDLQSRAAKLQKDIDDAERNHNPPTRPSDPANQEAARLADAARHLAQQQALANPSQRGAAKAAEEEADAAKREALQGHASAARQHLSNAASQLGAGQSVSSADQGKAAEEARRLAQAQRDLANQTSQAHQTLQTAEEAKSNADQSAAQQQRLADQMEQAARSARELQQKTQGAAPGLSQQAQKAAQSLENAAQAQRAAAQATRNGNTAQSIEKQAQAARSLQEAQQSLPQSREQSTQSDQSARQGESQSDQQGSRQSAQGSRLGQGNQSSQSPTQGRPGSQGPGGMSSPIGQSGTTGSSGSGGSSAAQAVQAARNAQSAAASGDPAAAQQAAEQLSQASQELLNGNPGGDTRSGQSPGQNSAGSNASSGSAPGRPGGNAGSAASAGPASGNPNAPGGNGSGLLSSPQQKPPAQMPKPVEDIGLSPSDWAKLPPNTQEQLLNAAQQSGPPAYRDAIKNYYSRIAKLEQSSEAAK